jgi:uncharacterized Rmd1/YagE family protein
VSGESTFSACQVCNAPDRSDIELAYMTGERVPIRFSRAKVERHMAHVTEPEALKIALGMSTAVSLATRLRYLESQATAILDAAMDTQDATLALKAMREVRATMELMGRIGGALIDRVSVNESRPDLDAAIADALKAKGVPVSDVPGADTVFSEPLALPRGADTEAERV